MVTLNIGKPVVVFNIDRDVLCDASTYLQIIFPRYHGNFLQTRNLSRDLPHENPFIFKPILRWLYNAFHELLNNNGSEGSASYFEHLIEIYAAEEKYGIFRLKNHLIDHILVLSMADLEPESLAWENHETACSILSKGMALGHLLVAWYLFSVGPESSFAGICELF